MMMASMQGPRSGADMFAFAGGAGEAARIWEAAATMWAAPWRAYWAVALEALDPANYGRRF
jgi:hypothetical protein